MTFDFTSEEAMIAFIRGLIHAKKTFHVNYGSWSDRYSITVEE